MEKNNVLSKEDRLLRKGNLVNSLGVLRAMAIIGSLTKEHFIELAKKNYLIGIDDKIKFELVLKEDIDKVWLESKESLSRMNILDIFNSTDELYIMADKETIKKMEQLKQKEFEQLVFENTHCKICGNEYSIIKEKSLTDEPIYKRYGFSEEKGYMYYHSINDEDIHCCKECFKKMILPLFRR
jgi:predicted Zn-ribbon and HTH transcriptional regulator